MYRLLFCLLVSSLSLLSSELPVETAQVEIVGQVKENKHKTTRIFYQVSKDGEHKGYLLGTIHCNFGLLDYEEKKKQLKPYVDQCEDFFFEVDVKVSYLNMSYGIERVVFDLLSEKQLKELFYFEELMFQQAMLLGPCWWGDKVHLPLWHNITTLSEWSTLICFLNTYRSLLAQISNNYINNKKHLEAVYKAQKDSHNFLVKMFESYLHKEVFEELSDFDDNCFCISQRNEAWIELL
ncbi:hypothetical protein JKY79_00860, partial [Candidatus Babeliales bacterium]|nr:hypothetical protein [Candidatus Babeliales bacterium]